MRGIRKKGDIELGKIVTFIIVAVVLIVVVAFFLGGTTGVTKAIKRVFFGVTAGTDITLATENCRQYCEQAKILTNAELKKSSAYCTRYENIDKNQDGEADYVSKDSDKLFDRYYCWPNADKNSIGRGFEGNVDNLGVPCDLGQDERNMPIVCGAQTQLQQGPPLPPSF